MKKTLHKIHNFLFGRVYYAVIVGEAGSGNRYDITSHIATASRPHALSSTSKLSNSAHERIIWGKGKP